MTEIAQGAVSAVRETSLLIGGRPRRASGGATFDRHDPFTGKVATRAAAATPGDASAVVDTAAAAFPEWSASLPRDRRAAMLRAADLLEDRAEQLVELMISETGATWKWARHNIEKAKAIVLEAGAQVYNVTGEILPADMPNGFYMVTRAPCGVILSIAPWNAPLVLAARALAFPLAFGNTVVLKASELCPATHVALGEMFVDAGVLPGAVNVVTHAPADAPRVVETLIAHPAVRRINFTGSTAVGRVVAELAGRHLKRVLLELGGKNPLIVLADADLEYAAHAATFGAFANSGQACMASNRILVEQAIADELIERVVARAEALPSGDPRSPDTVIGPLANEQSLAKVQALVDDAVEHGARMLCGGMSHGLVYRPTVLVGIAPEMRLYDEEVFGPIAPITVVDAVEDAVRIANQTSFGLSAGILTSDIDRGFEIAAQIESGMAHVNNQTLHDEPHVPFGGVKDSGFGRFGGRYAIDEFTELRWVTAQRVPRQFPF